MKDIKKILNEYLKTMTHKYEEARKAYCGDPMKAEYYRGARHILIKIIKDLESEEK